MRIDITQVQAMVEKTLQDYRCWFEQCDQTGDLQGLEAAINYAERAVAAAPEDHPSRATLCSNLGKYLCNRYQRAGNLQDLEGAINYTEAAVAATPEDHPDRPGWLNYLGPVSGSGGPGRPGHEPARDFRVPKYLHMTRH